MFKCSAASLSLMCLVSLAPYGCSSRSTAAISSRPQIEHSGGRAQRLVAAAPKKVEPYFGNVMAFVIRTKLDVEDDVQKSGDFLLPEDAKSSLADALIRRGIRVVDGEPAQGKAAYVNLWMELSSAADARRYGYRLAVTKDDVGLDKAFEKDVPSYLSDRGTGSVAVAGRGSREADLSLIETMANRIAHIVPKGKRSEAAELSSQKPEPGIGNVDAFIVRTRFDFDPRLELRKGYWTAGSAKAYLTKLLRDRGLKVVESPSESAGQVAYVNHWIKGKPRRGRDGFDYRYEANYAVTLSDQEYKPILDSQDSGTGSFAYFEEGERLDLERYADELASVIESGEVVR
ncbi:hypothetical protein EON82_14315 [bacterium]|nr:MAG: hypothetical protein EON82_14315 [bacterium]